MIKRIQEQRKPLDNCNGRNAEGLVVATDYNGKKCYKNITNATQCLKRYKEKILLISL